MRHQGNSVGDKLPKRGNRLSRALARMGMTATGWSFEGAFPDIPKAVIIVVPHTSNWDFLVGIFAVFALGIRASFLGKHQLFRWPIGWLMRWLGGIPVDRRASGGVVEQIVERFRCADRLLLGMSPEGTRKRVARWKTGFYRIAVAAGVPILPVSFDYSRRVVRLGNGFIPTGDMARDLEELGHFFSDVVGRRDELSQLNGATPAEAPAECVTECVTECAT